MAMFGMLTGDGNDAGACRFMLTYNGRTNYNDNDDDADDDGDHDEDADDSCPNPSQAQVFANVWPFAMRAVQCNLLGWDCCYNAACWHAGAGVAQKKQMLLQMLPLLPRLLQLFRLPRLP